MLVLLFLVSYFPGNSPVSQRDPRRHTGAKYGGSRRHGTPPHWGSPPTGRAEVPFSALLSHRSLAGLGGGTEAWTLLRGFRPYRRWLHLVRGPLFACGRLLGHCLAPCHACLVCDASSRALFASNVCGPCLLALVLLRLPAWLCPCAFLWPSYMRSPSGLWATLAAMANARDALSLSQSLSLGM